MKLDIFMPIYNGSKYLLKTLDSIATQDWEDFRVLCVDDESTDASCEIIRDFASKDPRFVLFQKSNEGNVPYSWRYVIPKLKGDYVQYMSQDDLLSPGYLHQMALRAEATGADAIVPAVEFYHEGKENNRIDIGWPAGGSGTCEAVIDGKTAFVAALDFSIPGFCWWKRDLIQRIPFVCDAFNSDELMQRIWFRHCEKVAFSEALFKYRRDNENAITRTFHYRHYSSLKTNLHLLSEMIKENVGQDMINKLGGRYFMGLFVLMRQLARFGNDYSIEQRNEVNDLILLSYEHLAPYARYSEGGFIKKYIWRLFGCSFRMMCLGARLLK
ncbi:MAG: glycosyltransferase family 2 protein [Lentisphaeria bacterium]|jgi:glycosyltransferase involved in cell wall biosynthesis